MPRTIDNDETIDDRPMKIFLVLPYVSKTVEEFGINLTRMVESTFDSVKFHVVFKAPREIRQLFHYKDVIPKMMQSCVVYRIYCNSCESSYIGRTTRHLRTRIDEHKKGEGGEYDPISGKAEDHATVYNHQIDLQHDIDNEDVKIIAKADTNNKLAI